MIIFEYEIRCKKNGFHLKKETFFPLLQKGIEVMQRENKIKKKFKNNAIHLAIVEDQEIWELNKIYRGKDKPTDVLSFSYFEEQSFPGKENLMGEIVISFETAQRQAKEHKKTLEQEIHFLFVHGFLHLFGYDHEKKEEKKVMFGLQDEILGTKMWRKIIGY